MPSVKACLPMTAKPLRPEATRMFEESTRKVSPVSPRPARERMIWSMRSSPWCMASTPKSLPEASFTGMLTVRMGRKESGEGYTLCTVGPWRPWV